MSKDAWLLLMGTVGKPHGIKGEMAINWQSDTALQKDCLLYIGGCDEHNAHRVLAVRTHKGRPIVLLSGVETRNQAEAMTSASIFMAKKDLPPLEPDEVYLQDIIGFKVCLPDGNEIGRLDHVESPSKQELWVIIGEGGQEILFPAQPCFIKSFEMAENRIIIDPPPGLLEIYRHA